MQGIAIRPIAASDRDRLAAAFERLSPESRYLRFFSTISRLSQSQLTYLTEVDHHDHEALVAVDEATGGLVGVARYVRTDPGVAEPAVVVADDWQGRGIGSSLLDQLASRAREEGIAVFAAVVLAHNEAALVALGRLGESRVVSQGQHVEVHIDLAAPETASTTLQDLLRRAAEQSIGPAVSFLQRLAAADRGDEGPRENVMVVAADAALAPAAELAAATGATLHVVRLERHAEPGSLPDSAVVHHRHGDIAAALLETAVEQRARLIVVDGSAPARERFTLKAWDHVAHNAPCDVLVLRQRDDSERRSSRSQSTERRP